MVTSGTYSFSISGLAFAAASWFSEAIVCVYAGISSMADPGSDEMAD